MTVAIDSGWAHMWASYTFFLLLFPLFSFLLALNSNMGGNKRKKPLVKFVEFKDPDSLIVEDYSYTTMQSAPLLTKWETILMSSLIDIPTPSEASSPWPEDFDPDAGIKFGKEEPEPPTSKPWQHKVIDNHTFLFLASQGFTIFFRLPPSYLQISLKGIVPFWMKY